MPFTPTELLNNADKNAEGILGTANTSPGQKYNYNENYPVFHLAIPERIWLEFNSIPGAATPALADAAVLANPTILSKEKYRLTLDVTSNNRSFVARATYGDMTSTRVQNWLHPVMIRTSGDSSWGYMPRLYHGDPDAGGVEITTAFRSGPTGAPCWGFICEEGVLRVSTDESGYFKTNFYDVNGLWIQGYRYIGPTGASSTASSRFTRLEITGAISSGTTLDVTASGANYTKTGDNGYLETSNAAFLANHGIAFHNNGVEQDKDVDIIWSSATLFTIMEPLDAGDILTIYS
jgi:hypothetical protein